MLNTFLELTGVTMPGSIIEVHIDDKVGALHDIYHEVRQLYHQYVLQ